MSGTRKSEQGMSTAMEAAWAYRSLGKGTELAVECSMGTQPFLLKCKIYSYEQLHTLEDLVYQDERQRV